MSPAAESPAVTPDPLLLLPLRQRILEQRLGVRALHLHRPGRAPLVHRFADDTAENVYSVSKTVTALAVGIARAEGLLDIEDRLVDHLPAPAGGYGEGVEQIRLRHLLQMTSGSPVTCFVDTEREHPDPAALFLATDLLHAPGERFEYSNGGVLMFSRVVTEATGLSLRDWLLPRLFHPLGILNPQWATTRAGHTWGATGLQLRSGQMARLGDVLAGEGPSTGRPWCRGSGSPRCTPRAPSCPPATPSRRAPATASASGTARCPGRGGPTALTASSCWSCPSRRRCSRSPRTSRAAAAPRSSAPCGRSCCRCCEPGGPCGARAAVSRASSRPRPGGSLSRAR